MIVACVSDVVGLWSMTFVYDVIIARKLRCAVVLFLAHVSGRFWMIILYVYLSGQVATYGAVV